MPTFSLMSEKNLELVHPDLKRLFREIVKTFDCAVMEGHRGEQKQKDYYTAGVSKVQWPNSKHNWLPSHAVDVVPWPCDWSDISRFYFFAGYVKGVALSMGIKIRLGCDWDGDMQVKDQNFNDLPHFELII